MESSDTNQKKRSHISNNEVDNEVQKLFKKNGKITVSDFHYLRQKYGDVELADKIQKTYIDKYHLISKKAKKFAKLIREKFPTDYPFHTLLEKARMAKTRYNLSENEFAEFQRIFEQELIDSKSPSVVVPFNNMTKILGSVVVTHETSYFTNLSSKDWDILQNILKLHASSKLLHSQVVLQSLQYKSYDKEAVSGVYDRKLGISPTDAIHPIIAALFLPRVEILETMFLHANIAGIIKARYKNESFYSRADYELFYALCNDPNDVVCDGHSIMADLYNRALVQKNLWNCVLNLRNGNYFNPSFNEFIVSIDMCRVNKYDTPDLIYGRYEGTILKRLFNCFSFRPTVISTAPVFTMTVNPYQQTVRPIVTKLPMINLRLPNEFSNERDPINLKDALEQDQMFIADRGLLIPRKSNIIYSRNVLFFYIDRRSNVIKMERIEPYSIDRFPIAVSGFDRLNDHSVEFETEFKYANDTYRLFSVVIAQVNHNLPEKKLIVGSSTLCMNHDSTLDQLPVARRSSILYDPFNVYRTYTDPVEPRGEPDRSISGQVISEIESLDQPSTVYGDSNFKTLAEKCGMIFMYVNDKVNAEFEMATN